jgi:cell shape-determining protein MreD
MPRSLRQVLVLLACAGGLVGLVGQLNHGLAPLGLTLTVPGLLVCYAALRLPLQPGLLVACLAGLWIDAAAPVAFGRHALLLGLAFCVVHNLRARLPREETLVGVVAALFVNLALFVVFALLDLGALPDPAAGGLRLLADLVVSQLFTALIGPWFIALQTHALQFARARPEAAVSRFA